MLALQVRGLLERRVAPGWPPDCAGPREPPTVHLVTQLGSMAVTEAFLPRNGCGGIWTQGSAHWRTSHRSSCKTPVPCLWVLPLPHSGPQPAFCGLPLVSQPPPGMASCLGLLLGSAQPCSVAPPACGRWSRPDWGVGSGVPGGRLSRAARWTLWNCLRCSSPGGHWACGYGRQAIGRSLRLPRGHVQIGFSLLCESVRLDVLDFKNKCELFYQQRWVYLGTANNCNSG